MIQLIDIYDKPEAEKVLFDLMLERTPEQSISHKAMPSFEQHRDFLRSKPYKAWYLIHGFRIPEGSDLTNPPLIDDGYVGATNMTKDSEIGLFIFNAHKRKGYGREAFDVMRRFYGQMLANISPYNFDSQRFFCSQGAKLVQCTYKIPVL